ncbi:MAG: hypothetical protein ACYDBL_07220, partial [Candidatus Acidiferrales bacterium]
EHTAATKMTRPVLCVIGIAARGRSLTLVFSYSRSFRMLAHKLAFSGANKSNAARIAGQCANEDA